MLKIATMKLKNKDLKSLRLLKKFLCFQEHLKRRLRKESEQFTQPWFLLGNIGNVMNMPKKKLEKKTKTNPAKKSENQGEEDLIPAKITKNATSKKKIGYNSDSSNSSIDLAYDDDDMDLSDNGELELQVGKYAIIKYEEKYYPGLIMKYDNEGAEIRSMDSAGVGSWKWPVKEDILYYFRNDIVRIVADPVAKNKRGFYTVPGMDNYE